MRLAATPEKCEPLLSCPDDRRYNKRGHHLVRIVAGYEPAVSGGLGSQVIDAQ